MNHKLILMLASVFIFNSISAMESGRTSKILPLEFAYFDKLPKNKQQEVLLKSFENIVDKNLSIFTNIQDLLKQLSNLFYSSSNVALAQAIPKNRELLFKKMGYELSKVFSLQDLNNALIDPAFLDKDKIQVLIFAGADVNFNNGYTTPLLAVARDLNLPVMKLLIEKGADINAVVTKGRYIGQTPLISVIVAKRSGPSFTIPVIKAEAVEILLKSGAQVGTQDANGKTALDYARENGFKDIERILSEAAIKQSPNIKISQLTRPQFSCGLV